MFIVTKTKPTINTNLTKPEVKGFGFFILLYFLSTCRVKVKVHISATTWATLLLYYSITKSHQK
jgi:hypothetical protein